jgi:hypothetical protein
MTNFTGERVMEIKQTRNQGSVLLIVEDDEALNQQYQLFCQLAIGTLDEPGVQATYQVESVFSYEDAVRRLNEGGVTLLSVDLALQSAEIGLREKDRREGNEPGGMRLLKHIQTLPKHPLVMVVSGETLLSYARDALQRYGVLAYFQKGQPGFEEDYLHTVQAALALIEANAQVELLESFQAMPEVIETAMQYWQKASQHAVQANLGEWSLPGNLEVRLAAIKTRLFAGSNIPGEEWTKGYLRKRIFRTEQWVLVQAYLENFESFATGQASQVDPLMCYVAGMIQDVGQKITGQLPFVGAWGHENLVGPCILALFPSNCASQMGELGRALLDEFRASSGKFVHGYQISPDHGPLPELALRIWPGVDQPFMDWPEFVDKISAPGAV